MIHRLSGILKKCENKKFKNGYIKYLKSLDFNEFEELFLYYASAIATLLIIYQKHKIKIFSKKWLKFHILKYKWDLLYLIFSNANHDFVMRTSKNLDIRNTKKMDLIKKIKEARQELDSIVSNPIILTQNSTQENIIKFNLIIIDSIYTSEKLTKLVDELNNIQ